MFCMFEARKQKKHEQQLLINGSLPSFYTVLCIERHRQQSWLSLAQMRALGSGPSGRGVNSRMVWNCVLWKASTATQDSKVVLQWTDNPRSWVRIPLQTMPCLFMRICGNNPDFHNGRIWLVQKRWVHWRFMPNMSCVVKCWDAPFMGTLKSLILWSIYKAPAAIRPSNSKLYHWLFEILFVLWAD